MLFNPDLITDDERDLVRLRHSILERFRDDPKYFYDYHIAKTVKPGEPTAPMRLGSAVDGMLLSNAKVEVIDEKLSKSTSKASLKKKQEIKAGLWLSEADHEKAIRMVECARANPDVMALLDAPHECQKQFLWDCPHTGFPKRATLDYFGEFIIDLKTTSAWNLGGGRLGGFVHSAGHGRQLSLYQEGVAAVTGESKPCKLIYISSDTPHRCLVVDVPQNALDLGHLENETSVRELEDCHFYNSWVQRGGYTRTLVFPEWVYEK